MASLELHIDLGERVSEAVSEIDETVNLYYAPAGAIDEVAEDEFDPFDDAADPEPYENGVIDLGEAVAQQLSLAIDPYPRSAATTDSEADDMSKTPAESEAQPTHRPFEGLDALMKARKSK